jgi:hypothetical protein
MLEARGIKQAGMGYNSAAKPIIGPYYYIYMVMDVWVELFLGVGVQKSNAANWPGNSLIASAVMRK